MYMYIYIYIYIYSRAPVVGEADAQVVHTLAHEEVLAPRLRTNDDNDKNTTNNNNN